MRPLYPLRMELQRRVINSSERYLTVNRDDHYVTDCIGAQGSKRVSAMPPEIAQ
jgi:hypothetical protein